MKSRNKWKQLPDFKVKNVHLRMYYHIMCTTHILWKCENPSLSFRIRTRPSIGYCPATLASKCHQSSQAFWDCRMSQTIMQTIKKCHHSWYTEKTPGSPRAHTIVELAVGFLTVDDVEAVREGSPHAAHLEVEPLLVLGAVHIRIDQQVVLKPVESETSWKMVELLFKKEKLRWFLSNSCTLSHSWSQINDICLS